MQQVNGKIAIFFAGGALIGGVPLLLVILIVLDHIKAKNAGQSFNGDAIGLMMLAVCAYVFALLSFSVALFYFGYMRAFKKRRIKRWHLLALACAAIVISAPIAYLATV